MVIKRIAIGLLSVGKVVLDILLEVSELPIRDEDVSERLTCFGSDTQQFDLLLRVTPDLIAEALEGQGHIRHANKLDLKA